MTDDFKLYSAPTFWRLHKDKVWIAIAICLWVVAMVQPDNAERQRNAGAAMGQGAGDYAPINTAVSAPLCQSLYRGSWLRLAIKHSGDVEKLRIECHYQDKGVYL